MLDGLHSKMEMREDIINELKARSIVFIQARQYSENRLKLNYTES